MDVGHDFSFYKKSAQTSGQLPIFIRTTASRDMKSIKEKRAGMYHYILKSQGPYLQII